MPQGSTEGQGNTSMRPTWDDSDGAFCIGDLLAVSALFKEARLDDVCTPDADEVVAVQSTMIAPPAAPASNIATNQCDVSLLACIVKRLAIVSPQIVRDDGKGPRRFRFQLLSPPTDVGHLLHTTENDLKDYYLRHCFSPAGWGCTAAAATGSSSGGQPEGDVVVPPPSTGVRSGVAQNGAELTTAMKAGNLAACGLTMPASFASHPDSGSEGIEGKCSFTDGFFRHVKDGKLFRWLSSSFDDNVELIAALAADPRTRDFIRTQRCGPTRRTFVHELAACGRLEILKAAVRWDRDWVERNCVVGGEVGATRSTTSIHGGSDVRDLTIAGGNSQSEHRKQLPPATADLRSVEPLPCVFIQDTLSSTPLHDAAYNGHLELIRFLLSEFEISRHHLFGADKYLTERSACTPLHFAAQRGHPEVLQLFLTWFAITTEDVVIRLQDEMGLSLFHVAAANNHVNCLDVLLTHLVGYGDSPHSAADLASGRTISKRHLVEGLVAGRLLRDHRGNSVLDAAHRRSAGNAINWILG